MLAAENADTLAAKRIARIVGLFYYLGALFIFREVLFSIPALMRGTVVVNGDELVPFFNPRSQLLEQAAGEFNQLTNGYEFRVRYSFLTTWFRHHKVPPFAVLFVIPSIYWVVYLTVARFVADAFKSLTRRSVYLAAAAPTCFVYLIMTYSKVTHFYTLILGLGLFTIASLKMLYVIIFAETKWMRHMVVACLVSLFNPAVHYLILFALFASITVFTLFLGEVARWLRTGGPGRVFTMPRLFFGWLTTSGRFKKALSTIRSIINSTIGRCAISMALLAWIAMTPYAIFVKYVALRGVDLTETVPGGYYFIRDASVAWQHVLAWDLAGIMDKVLFGDYLSKNPRWPNMIYTVIYLVPAVVPMVRRSIFVSRPHRQFLGVVYVASGFAAWATIGYADPVWFPTFHRTMASLTRAMYSTNSTPGNLTLDLTSTIVQVLRFPHRFQLILFMLAPLVLTLSLAWAIDRLSIGLKVFADKRTGDSPHPLNRGSMTIRLVAAALLSVAFMSPFWSNGPYRRVFRSGNFAGFFVPYPVGDLAELKGALLELPEGKTVILPPTETAKLVEDENGNMHKFIDKFYIYYLDQPSFYYGLTGEAVNKFEFFLILRGMYYQEDWWLNPVRDINLRYVVVNKTIVSNDGLGAEYLPNVESYIHPRLERLDNYFERRFENDSFILYELTDLPNPDREKLLLDVSWTSYLELVYDRLDLSRCYDFEYLPYFKPTELEPSETISVMAEDPRSAAIDIYAISNPGSFTKPSQKIFAFNDNLVSSSYYLWPMFRMFLMFSNTKWNRTGVITPGLFGTLRGSFVGVPRATQYTVPVAVTEAGRYRVLMRMANTTNALSVEAASLDYQEDFEIRASPDSLQSFDEDTVYLRDRIPVDLSGKTIEEIEDLYNDRLVPVNSNFSYQDLGVVDAPVGVHTFRVEKFDDNPMLVEGIVIIPENEFETLELPATYNLIEDPKELDCSDRYPELVGDSNGRVDFLAQNDPHTKEGGELLTIAAAGVEQIAPDEGGGVVGLIFVDLSLPIILLLSGGLLIRWRVRSGREERSDEDEE